MGKYVINGRRVGQMVSEKNNNCMDENFFCKKMWIKIKINLNIKFC